MRTRIEAMGPAVAAGGRALLSGLGDLLAPPACAACGEPLARRRAFCERCEVGLLECDPDQCAGCGASGARDGLCRACRGRLRPLAGASCAFAYEGPLADALQGFKYHGRDELGALLGERWVRALALPAWILSAAPLVVPIPLHVRRLRRRGFDQAWLLARWLARSLGLEAAPRLLRRERETRPQVGLRRAEREANVRGAFRAGPRAAGRAILLVDDVLTTGATLKAAAAALREAGAGPVFGVTVARALE